MTFPMTAAAASSSAAEIHCAVRSAANIRHALRSAVPANDHHKLALHPSFLSHHALLSLLTNHANAVANAVAKVNAKPAPTTTPNRPTTTAMQPVQQSHQFRSQNYVNALIDASVQTITSIWPNAGGTQTKPIANLNAFLRHILRHSHVSHSTLQLALCYLVKIRSKVQHLQDPSNVFVACGRRMFLAALICSHKFLQDKTFKNSAWSKICGLSISEVNQAERTLLELLEYQLYVSQDFYNQSTLTLHRQFHTKPPMTPTHSTAAPEPLQLVPSPTTIRNGMPTPVDKEAFSEEVSEETAHIGLLSPPTRVTEKRRRKDDDEEEENQPGSSRRCTAHHSQGGLSLYQ